MTKKLTERQERFCREFAASGNGYRSALAAGYSDNYASGDVKKIIDNNGVQERLRELHAEHNSELIATSTELKERLTQIIRNQAAEEVVVTEGTGDGRSAAKVIEKKAAVKDQLKAIELLGKMGGMFTTNLNVDGDMALNIKVDYGTDGTSE